jgi:hypothetical protein
MSGVDAQLVVGTLVLAIGMGGTLTALRWAGYVDRRLRARGWLLAAVGHGVQGLGYILMGIAVMPMVMAAMGGYCLYEWWNNGGGDGMKRRLKKAAGYLGFGPGPAPQGT